MKSYRPTTKSRRHMTTASFKQFVTVDEPHKALTKGGKRRMGRNNAGRITTRHKGGGSKRLFRDIDFTYTKLNVPGRIETIEYDPNRSAYVSLVCFRDGERRYVITPKSLKVGDEFIAGEKVPVRPGNKLPLKNIPVGTFIYALELKPKGGAKLGRSAGNFIEVVAQDTPYTSVKLPSSEIRKIQDTCFATIGEVSNDEHHLVNFGKAGRSRWKGIRPTVRGSAMNPVDHPYGGGEGRQGRGLRRAKTLWGKPSGKGQKTRSPKKYSNQFIVSRRRVGKIRKTA